METEEASGNRTIEDPLALEDDQEIPTTFPGHQEVLPVSKKPKILNSFSLSCLKVECKSHPRTNSRVPWGAVELSCFEKISWARLVKILVRYWLRIRSMCVYV